MEASAVKWLHTLGHRCKMVQLGDVLKAIGPNASIVFAAWIFMGFLQQRYDSAIDRYRGAVGDYRSGDHDQARTDNLREQVVIYRRRCWLMGHALLTGLAAAMLLIASLILGALDVVSPDVPLIAWVGTAAAIAGFALIIVAALIVWREARLVTTELDNELRDVPELARDTGHQPGGVAG
jgi:hypothetical protein